MRYEGARALIEAGVSLAGTQTHADKIARKGQDVKTAKARAAKADRKADELDALVGDDGIPPEPPIGLLVTPFFRSLIVSWIDPPDSDLVNSSIVEITPEGGSASTYRGDAYGITIPDLEPAVLHTLRVRLRDRFGRLSGWSDPVSATPERNASDSVDLTAAEIAGSLGWENLDALDANSGLTLSERQAKLGDDVITARAMATQDLAATRLWAQIGAFESAMIANLVVDKLLAGTFTAGEIILAGGGSIKAGRITLNSLGVTLPSVDALYTPGSLPDHTISVSGGWADLSFYRDSTRGAVLQAEGNANYSAFAQLKATNPNSPNSPFGEITVDAYKAGYSGVNLGADRAYIRGRLWVMLGGSTLQEVKKRSDGTLYV